MEKQRRLTRKEVEEIHRQRVEAESWEIETEEQRKIVDERRAKIRAMRDEELIRQGYGHLLEKIREREERIEKVRNKLLDEKFKKKQNQK